jgi:glycosyltransferase involved in cell wall biosynthesis
MNQSLTIIVVAYRKKYLREVLESFAGQTSKDFSLHIVDDASPHDLQAVIATFEDKLNIKYIRCQENYGGTSLTKQWQRAVEICDPKEWIWLFCDDDKCDDTCVASFWQAQNERKTNGPKVFRFATKIIDEHSNIVSQKYTHPILESGTDFFVRKIRGETRSSLSEYIFHRSAFNKYGFQHFPLAWHADDAAWISFSYGNAIRTCNDAEVYFRLTSESISGSTQHYIHKMEGARMFVEWLLSTDFIDKTKVSPQTWLYTYYTVEMYFVNRLVPMRLTDVFTLWKIKRRCVGFFEALKIVKLAKVLLPKPHQQ